MNVTHHSKQAVGQGSILAVLLLLLGFTAGARAQLFFSICDSAVGNWHTDSDWAPTIVPNSQTEVAVGTLGIHNITTTAKVGITYGDAFSYRASIGASNGFTGTVNVDINRTWTISEVLNVGLSGKGTLNMNGAAVWGAAVGSNDTTYIGRYSDSDGTVNMYGSSPLTNGGHVLYVGYEGKGTLNVHENSVVSNTSGYIGYHSGSIGAVTVDGYYPRHSQWNNSGPLFVGYEGNGTLNIQSGGTVSSTGDAYIGYNSGSTGAVTFDGAGSQWTGVTNFTVGDDGSGTLTVQNGANVSTVNGTLLVGNRGSGTLTIQNGGTVSNKFGYVGNSSGITGSVTVSGAGSQWNISGQTSGPISLYVGASGTGTVTIQDGGKVSSYSSSIGLSSGGKGTMTVTGTGSELITTYANGGVQVGDDGNGTLNIQAGGKVSNTSGTIGTYSTGTGLVTLTGAGSQWINSKELNVGRSGNGTLAIQNGGTVSNTYGYIGYFSTGTGSVTLAGPGSQWTNSRDLYVGYSGNGTLAIQNGGTASSNYGYVGNSTGSTGSVTVTGAGSQWTNSNYLYIGSNGNGTLAIQNGGMVSNTYGYIGYYTGRTGTATVTGSGSQWTNSSNLYVGYNGNGTLTVDAGGKVTVQSYTYLAYSASSTGGALNLNGSVGSRGILETAGVYGNGAASSSLTFNGGILRATSGLSVYGFQDGKVQIQSGGAFVDMQGYYGSITGSMQGPGGLTKQGSGELYLSGDSTYTGGTVVEAGLLYLNGSIKGPLTVNSAGTLFGNGVINGNTVINGKAFPGNGSWGLHFDNCTWNGSTDGSATMLLSLNDTDSGKLMIGQAFNKGGTNSYRFDFQGTGPAPSASKTYSLASFGSTTFSASDFSYTNLAPGYIGVFAMVGGELQFQVTRDPLKAWRQTHFDTLNGTGNAANFADPDGDGGSNLLEFARDGNPNNAANDGKTMTKFVDVAGTSYFTITLPVRAGASFAGSPELLSEAVDGIIYHIQAGTDLATFLDIPVVELSPPQSAGVPLSPGWQYRTFGIVAGSKGFLRLGVNLAP